MEKKPDPIKAEYARAWALMDTPEFRAKQDELMRESIALLEKEQEAFLERMRFPKPIQFHGRFTGMFDKISKNGK